MLPPRAPERVAPLFVVGLGNSVGFYGSEIKFDSLCIVSEGERERDDNYPNELGNNAKLCRGWRKCKGLFNSMFILLANVSF